MYQTWLLTILKERGTVVLCRSTRTGTMITQLVIVITNGTKILLHHHHHQHNLETGISGIMHLSVTGMEALTTLTLITQWTYPTTLPSRLQTPYLMLISSTSLITETQLTLTSLLASTVSNF